MPSKKTLPVSGISFREEVRIAVTVGEVLGNPIRQKIIRAFFENPKNPELYHNQICKNVGGSKSTVHKYVKELVRSKILLPRVGYARSSKIHLVEYYSINPRFRPFLEANQELLKERKSLLSLSPD